MPRAPGIAEAGTHRGRENARRLTASVARELLPDGDARLRRRANGVMIRAEHRRWLAVLLLAAAVICQVLLGARFRRRTREGTERPTASSASSTPVFSAKATRIFTSPG